MLKKPLEIKTSVDVLRTLDEDGTVYSLIIDTIEELINSENDELNVCRDQLAPAFFSDIENSALHIDANWLSTCVINFFSKNYTLDEESQSTVKNLFTSTDNDFDNWTRRLLFVELLGRKHDLMSTKQLKVLGHHDYCQETQFVLSNGTHFHWPSFTISTKKLQKFIKRNAIGSHYDDSMQKYKTLAYRPNDVVHMTTSKQEIEASLALDETQVLPSSYNLTGDELYAMVVGA